MPQRASAVAVVVAGLLSCGEPGGGGAPTPAYRVLAAAGPCLPCGGESYVVLDSEAKLEELYGEAKERCRGSGTPDAWRRAIIDLHIDFRDEAIVTLYQVIGTGGRASLQITGPADGVLKAAIAWDTGPPPHVPIATAACFRFAVRKSAVERVDVLPGGVLDKTREELSLRVSTARPDAATEAEAPPR